MAAIYGFLTLKPLVSSGTILNESLIASVELEPLEASCAIDSQEPITLQLEPIEVAATLVSGNTLTAAVRVEPLDISTSIRPGRILSADLTLRPLEMAASRFTAAFSFEMEPLDASGTIISGNKLTSALTLRKLDASGTIANGSPFSAALELRPLVMSATFTQNTLIRADLQLKELAIAAQFYSGQVLRAALTLPVLEVDGELYPESRLSDTLTLPLLVLESTFGVTAPLSDAGYQGLSLNINENRALTRIDAHPFNSFAQFNGVYLAAGAGGIFALAGDADGAVAIDAVIRSGLVDFGSKELKRIRAGYINYRTDGTLTLKITTDEGESYEYTIERIDGDGIHSNRIKLGRGMIGRHFQWELTNRDGCFFEINDMTLLPQKLPRKFK